MERRTQTARKAARGVIYRRARPEAPPQNLEAEQATLGAMLLEREAIARVVDSLRPEDFGLEAHRVVYDAIASLFRRGEPVDPVTLGDELTGRGQHARIGGDPYLARLLTATPTAANVEHYAGIVKEKSRRRDLQALGWRLAGEAGNGKTSAEVMAGLRSTLDEMAEAEAADTFAALRCDDFLAAALPAPLWICEPLAAGGGLTFLFSRPGLGKSIFSFELARGVATGEPFLGRFPTTRGPALYFNLEMAAPQFQRRLRQFETHHPVGDAALYVVNEALALNDPASFLRFRALCQSIGPALVVIDPLIRALPGVDENAASEVNAALAPAADLARELGFGLLCIHHATKGDARRGLDSLAGSRDFGARADVALLMQTAVEDAEGGLLRVTCVKSRWGETLPPFCLRLENDAEGGLALLPADAPNAKNEVLEVLALRSPTGVKEIVAELEGLKSRSQVHRALAALLAEGRVRKTGYGAYAVSGGADG